MISEPCWVRRDNVTKTVTVPLKGTYVQILPTGANTVDNIRSPAINKDGHVT